MPRVSAKRQITLPARQCREVGIEPGDEYRSFVADGRITIMPLVPGGARGHLAHLAHLEGDPTVSEDESREGAIEEARQASTP